MGLVLKVKGRVKIQNRINLIVLYLRRHILDRYCRLLLLGICASYHPCYFAFIEFHTSVWFIFYSHRKCFTLLIGCRVVINSSLNCITLCVGVKIDMSEVQHWLNRATANKPDSKTCITCRKIWQ